VPLIQYFRGITHQKWSNYRRLSQRDHETVTKAQSNFARTHALNLNCPNGRMPSLSGAGVALQNRTPASTFEPSSQQFEQSFSGAPTSALPSPYPIPSNSRFDNSTKPSSSLLNNLMSFLEELLADQGRHNNLFVTQLVNLFIGSLTSASASTNHYSNVNGGLIGPSNSQFYTSYRNRDDHYELVG